METTRALRALAHPLTVASLVVLALNDHVLKQAWPGWFTGKLSDVVGLVVAPLLLAVPLALLGLRRPAVAAVLATGIGFALVKTTGAGSDLASALWSAAGWTSYLRRDPTDLIALPALLLALRVHRLAADPTTRLRRRATATVGALVLPFAVLATAATSACDDLSTSRGLSVLEGRWEAGDGWEQGVRIVYVEEYVLEPAAGGGLAIRLLSDAEQSRVTSFGDDHIQAVCDPARPRLCWRTYDPTRIVGDPAEADAVVVYASQDGGLTWSEENVLDEDAVRELRDDAGEVCGKPLRVDTGGLAVLSSETGPVVAVTLGGLGLAVREEPGMWRRLDPDQLREIAASAPSRSPAPLDDRRQLRPVEVPLPVTLTERPSPTPSYPTPALPPCNSPVAVTVTPDPRNGQPYVDLQCPPTPS